MFRDLILFQKNPGYKATSRLVVGVLFLEEIMIEKGFMVMRHGEKGKRPRFIHPTIGEALAEAHRLAEKTAIEEGDGTGAIFLILEVAGGCQVIDGKMQNLLPE